MLRKSVSLIMVRDLIKKIIFLLCGALVKKIRNGHECVETGGSESAADFRV